MREAQSKSFETTEGSAEITLPQLGGIESGKLLVKLVKNHGEAIGQVIKMFQGGAGAGGQVGESIKAFTSSLDESEFEVLLLKLTRGGRVNVGGEFVDLNKSTIDRLFTGETLELFKLLAFGLEVNYASFSKGLGELFSSMGLKMKTKNPPVQLSSVE